MSASFCRKAGDPVVRAGCFFNSGWNCQQLGQIGMFPAPPESDLWYTEFLRFADAMCLGTNQQTRIHE